MATPWHTKLWSIGRHGRLRADILQLEVGWVENPFFAVWLWSDAVGVELRPPAVGVYGREDPFFTIMIMGRRQERRAETYGRVS